MTWMEPPFFLASVARATPQTHYCLLCTQANNINLFTTFSLPIYIILRGFPKLLVSTILFRIYNEILLLAVLAV